MIIDSQKNNQKLIITPFVINFHQTLGQSTRQNAYNTIHYALTLSPVESAK